MIDKSIGLRIKARRKELKMTQQDLALLLGYKDRTAIAHIENGTKSLMQPKMKPMADALGVSVDWLMDWNDDLEGIISSLPASRKEFVSKFIDFMLQLTDDEIQEVIKHMEFTIYRRKE